MWTVAAVMAVLAWMAMLCAIDIREHRLPDVLTLPGAAVIVLGAVLAGRGVPAVVGAVALGGAYLAVHLVAPTGMGAGDVKLALGLGALTGALGAGVWVLSVLGAPVLTVLWALLSRRRRVPHGPSMCLAVLLAVWA